MTILDEIKAYKREFIEATRRETPLEAVRARAAQAPPTRGFGHALRGTRNASGAREPQDTLRVIAEIKHASPSAGVIRADFQPALHARSYESGGAAALSVLTDEKFFGGSLGALMEARSATSLPILRKEFTIDPYQVWEARAAGADAILLIAALEPWPKLALLAALARELTLDVLLEVHSIQELPRALELGPDLLGINNRDLRNREFKTDLSRTEELSREVPPEMTLVSESGIRDRADTRRLAQWGIDAILVGERLMREPDPGHAIATLLGRGRLAARETP